MIKRQFYMVEHGDKDDPSASSSSSSEGTKPQESDPSSSLSGYASDANSLGNEVELNSKGSSPANHSDDSETAIDVQNSSETKPSHQSKDYDDCGNDYVLKCKSVFKCRICPRIVCLNEESLKYHLQSKRHIRSMKLLNDGCLKSMLNSDGEVEDQETAAEMNARIVSMAKDNPTKNKKIKLEGNTRFKKKVREAGHKSGVVYAEEVPVRPSKKPYSKK